MKLSTLGGTMAGLAFLALTATPTTAVPVSTEKAFAPLPLVTWSSWHVCREGYSYGYCRFRRTGRIARGCCRIRSW